MSDTSIALGTPDATVDLRGTPCPINFVRAKLQLEKMAPGQLLEVWIDGGEPVEQVPHGLATSGYAIAALVEREEFFVLQVRNDRPDRQ